MKKVLIIFLIPFFALAVSGCVPLIIGGAVGVVGGYVISRDTIQGDIDKPYDAIWGAANTVAKINGKIQQEDNIRGYIELAVDSTLVKINLIRMTSSTTRIKVSARRHYLPNFSLAQDIFIKIMNEVR